MAEEHYKRIKEFHKGDKKVGKIVNTANHHHRQAYDKAVEEHLMDDNGHVDYEKLKENTDLQLKFADTMADFYLEKAEKALGAKRKKGKDKTETDLLNDRLLSAYSGITRAELKKHIGNYEHRFTFDIFNKHREQYMRQVENSLRGSAAQHLLKEDIGHIIKYIKAENMLDEKYVFDPKHIAPLISVFEEQGAVRRSDLEELAIQGDLEKKAIKKKKKDED